MNSLARMIGATFSLLVSVLIAGRLLTTTEGAPFGDTLVWALLSGVAASLAGMLVALGEVRFPKFLWIDVAVVLYCLAPCLSAAINWNRSDARTTLNILLELGGLGATWIALRVLSQNTTRQPVGWRLTIALTCALAVLGIWQHFGGYRAAREEYDRLVSEQQRLQEIVQDRRHPEYRAASRQLRDLELQFHELGIPNDARGRMLWEARLKASSEPIGRFALANTFAGLLLVGGSLLVAMLFTAKSPQRDHEPIPRLTWAILVVGCVLVGFCLLLTKSRTGFVGAVAGAGCFFIAWKLQRTTLAQRTWRVVGFAAAGLCLLLALGFVTGGLDRLVFSESFKSLRYRGEYWLGSLRMLFDHEHPGRWLSGVGPGNFRAEYLPFKLPESSEEIADPHNAFLDHWSSGGILGLVSIVGFWAWTCLGVTRPSVTPSDSNSDAHGHQQQASNADSQARFELLGLISTLIGLSLFAVDNSSQTELIILGLLSLVVYQVLPRTCFRPHDWSAMVQKLGLSVASGLLVHLLAAGGIAMPAIVVILFMLLLPSTDEGPNSGSGLAIDSSGGFSRYVAWCLIIGGLSLSIGVLRWGITPVIGCQLELANGDAYFSDGQSERANRAYRAAFERDSFSTVPLDRLATVAERRWFSSNSDADFQRAVELREQSIAQQPAHAAGWRLLGQLWRKKFSASHDQGDATHAVSAFREALRRHPTHVEIVAELALAIAEESRPQAAEAELQQIRSLQEINRRLGHVDKLLPDHLHDELKREFGEAFNSNGTTGTRE